MSFKSKSGSKKEFLRARRRRRIRGRIEGSALRPRLSCFRSNRHIYAQIVDDLSGKTLVAASSLDSEFSGKASGTIAASRSVGEIIAKKAIAKKISTVVFDRGGYLYHGRVRALADAAREVGLKF